MLDFIEFIIQHNFQQSVENCVEIQCNRWKGLFFIKETSFFEFFLNFLVSQQESYKEMRPLKRRGRLTAHKAPNFIRHTVSELIGLPVKGKTWHLKFTPMLDECS